MSSNSNNVGFLRTPTHPTFGRLILDSAPHRLFTFIAPGGILPGLGRLDIHEIGPQIGEAWWDRDHYHLRFDFELEQSGQNLHCIADPATAGAVQHLVRLKG